MTDRVGQKAGDVLQHLISTVVTHHVVNILEVIKVEEHNGHRRFFGQLLSHAFHEHFTVGQLRECIIVSYMLQLAERLIKLSI